MAGEARWAETATGRRIPFPDVSPEDVDIVDIARSLAAQCRYNGSFKRRGWYYSVAEHCWLLSMYLDHDTELALAALMHDADEFLISDIPKPVKVHLEPGVKDLSRQVEEAVHKRFGLGAEPALIKELDTRIVIDEKRALKINTGDTWEELQGHQPLGVRIRRWGPGKAERMFLVRFEELMRRRWTWAGVERIDWLERLLTGLESRVDRW